MNALFNAFVMFGRDLLDGSVTSTVLFVIVIELGLLIVDLIALLIVLLAKHVKAGRQEKDYYVPSAEPAEVSLKEIVLDTTAVRRKFTQGDVFDYDGLRVTARYSDGSELEISDFSVDKPDLDTVGECFVTVRYEGAAAEYTVSVDAAPAAERTLQSIEPDLADVVTEFSLGQPFSSEGLRIVAHYDAEPYTETVEDFFVAAPDTSVPGAADVLVTYGGLSCTYGITVKERKLTGLTLDTSAVKTEFTVGESFACGGLVVTAHYDAEPTEEQVEAFEATAPDLSEEGVKTVCVTYGGASATYEVACKPAPEPAPASYADTGVLRYDRSFTARLIQSDDEVKQWYSEIKNELLSYKKVKDRMSWKKETYRLGKDKVARMGFRGKVLCLYLALDPAEFADSKYKVEDAGENASTADTPCLYRIKNDKRAKYALQLIALMMERRGVPRIERESQDYYLPYEGLVELIDKGLVKREIQSGEEFRGAQPADENAVTAEAPAEPAPTVRVATEEDAATIAALAGTEESVEAGVLRYDRSFTARLIQSDDEVKQWYSEIKNELLSYKKVKDRMSWKKETYRLGKDKVARMGFRGKVLCLYLALDPAEFADSKYKVEDAGENASTADTPCLYRIKNDKRAKYALQLIALMMERRGVPRIERESQDYYLPYEGILELIKKGLIKRDVKSSSEEAIFRGEQPVDESAATAEPPVEESEPAAEEEQPAEEPAAEEPPAGTPAEAPASVGDPYGADVESEDGVEYEWSFRARLANGSPETGACYEKLKNALLSLADTERAPAFRAEGFVAGGKTIAKIAFVDKVLCLFLALDPASYEGGGYHVDDVADKPDFADTPLQYEIRGERDALLAIDLLADLAAKFGLTKVSRPEESFAEPHRDRDALVAEGLVIVRKPA